MTSKFPNPADDSALIVAGVPVSEEQFKKSVRNVLKTLSLREQLTPNKTARMVSLDPSFLRRVLQGKRTIGLFTLFKIASASKTPAAEIVGLIEAELRREGQK